MRLNLTAATAVSFALALIVYCTMALSANFAEAASTAHVAPRPWVFMLAGQSNMEGRGYPIPSEKPDARILRQGHVGQPWTVAADPLNGFGVGPGMSFAKEVLRQHPTVRIVLVPCAEGGTSIVNWQRWQPLYNDCMRRTRDAVRRGGVAKGILFAQGETDALFHERGDYWAERYQSTIRDMRRGLAAPSLPVVHTVIGKDALPGQFVAWKTVQRQQRRQLNSHDAAVKTSDLPVSGWPHYSVEGYRMLGRRMARAWAAEAR